MRATTIATLALLTASAGTAAEEADELSGIWIREDGRAGLVLHLEGDGKWLGRPTDMRRGAGIAWHFYRLGEGSYRFWIMAEGGRSVEKLAESEIRAEEDRLTVPVESASGDPGEMTFERLFRRVASRIGEVRISFRAPRQDDPDPDQYVDVRLAAAFERAVRAARKACPDLRRIRIAATAGSRSFRSPHHRRDRRTGIAIGAVNGVDLPVIGETARRAAGRVRDGETVVSPREAYLLAATTLVACLAAEEGIDEVGCAELLGTAAGPFHEWFLERSWRRLPGTMSLERWTEIWSDLRKRGGKTAGRIHVAVKPARRRLRVRDVWDDKHDRR